MANYGAAGWCKKYGGTGVLIARFKLYFQNSATTSKLSSWTTQQRLNIKVSRPLLCYTRYCNNMCYKIVLLFTLSYLRYVRVIFRFYSSRPF